MISFEEHEKYMNTEEGNPRFNRIKLLHKMLDNFGIDHSFTRKFDGYRIEINVNDDDKTWISIIEFDGSYGSDQDWLEYWTWELKEKEMDPICIESEGTMLRIIEYIINVRESD